MFHQAKGKSLDVKWKTARKRIDLLQAIQQVLDGRHLRHRLFQTLIFSWAKFYAHFFLKGDSGASILVVTKAGSYILAIVSSAYSYPDYVTICKQLRKVAPTHKKKFQLWTIISWRGKRQVLVWRTQFYHEWRECVGPQEVDQRRNRRSAQSGRERIFWKVQRRILAHDVFLSGGRENLPLENQEFPFI